MRLATIMLSTLAAIGSLIYAAIWQTPAAEAFALLTCGGLLTAAVAWHFRPRWEGRWNRLRHGRA